MKHNRVWLKWLFVNLFRFIIAATLLFSGWVGLVTLVVVRHAQSGDTLGGGIDKPNRLKNFYRIWPDLLDTNCLQGRVASTINKI